jgi:hypothetical protein
MPIEPTLWFPWLNGRQIPALASSIGASLSLWKVALFIFIGLVLVGFYAFYWRASWRAFRAASRGVLAWLPKAKPSEL